LSNLVEPGHGRGDVLGEGGVALGELNDERVLSLRRVPFRLSSGLGALRFRLATLCDAFVQAGDLLSDRLRIPRRLLAFGVQQFDPYRLAQEFLRQPLLLRR
jgi:hypothetical protein